MNSERDTSPEQPMRGNVNLDPKLIQRLESIAMFMGGEGIDVDSLVNTAVQSFVDGIDDVLKKDD
jgi:hypothetical protein